MFKLFQLIAVLISLPTIVACNSGSDDSEDNSYAYFKFYNASPNANVHQIFLEKIDDEDDEGEVSYGLVDYADASASYWLENDSYYLTIKRNEFDQNNEQIEVISSEITLNQDLMSLYIMTGDAAEPELTEFSYDTSSLDTLKEEDDENGTDRFELYLTNLSTTYGTLDVYFSSDQETFEQAQALTTLDYKTLSEQHILAQDIYKIYLTLPGSSEVIFESTPIEVSFSDTFIFSIRDDISASGLAIDKIFSSSAVFSYIQQDSQANIQFYQSDDKYTGTDIYLDSNPTPIIESLPADSLSLNQQITSQTYTITTQDSSQQQAVIIGNLLVNLDVGESKILLFYTDSEQLAQSLIFEQQTRLLAFDNQVRVVNIGQKDMDIDIYFVAAGETLGNTERFIKSIDYAEHRTTTVLTQEYQLFVTTTDDNGNLRSLYESEPVELAANVNYLLVIEPSEHSFSGFVLNIIEE